MKNLRISILAFLCALIGNAAQANITLFLGMMTVASSASHFFKSFLTSKPAINPKKFSLRFKSNKKNCIELDLMHNNVDIGSIGYNDQYIANASKGNTLTRELEYIVLYDESERGKGYGAAFMKLFIEKAIYDGVATISLASLPERVSFYKKLGFSLEKNTEFPISIMNLNLV